MCSFPSRLLDAFSLIFRLNLCLGEGVNVAVGMYAVAVTARKPGAIRLYRESNEPVRSKSRTFHTETGSLLLPSEIKKAQVGTRLLEINFFFFSPGSLLKRNAPPPAFSVAGVWQQADCDGER